VKAGLWNASANVFSHSAKACTVDGPPAFNLQPSTFSVSIEKIEKGLE